MQAQGEEGDMGSPISQYARETIGRRDKSVNGTTEERYPRDDLNVRHTAPEAVALSGLSYGGIDDLPITYVLYRFPAESATPLSLQYARTSCGSRTPVLHRETTELYRSPIVRCQTREHLT